MGVLETILIVLEALCSVALIVVVLMQSGKEAGLSAAISGASESYLSKIRRAVWTILWPCPPSGSPLSGFC